MYAGPHFFTQYNCLLCMDARHKPVIYLRFTALVLVLFCTQNMHQYHMHDILNAMYCKHPLMSGKLSSTHQSMLNEVHGDRAHVVRER